MKRIDGLFAIEREIKGQDPAARLAVRQRQSAPQVEDLRSQRALLSKHAKVAKAIDYLLASDHWPGFMRFLEDGRICLTSNCAERSLRGVALGKRSWLFAGSERGGHRAAFTYSRRPNLCEAWALQAAMILEESAHAHLKASCQAAPETFYPRMNAKKCKDLNFFYLQLNLTETLVDSIVSFHIQRQPLHETASIYLRQAADAGQLSQRLYGGLSNDR